MFKTRYYMPEKDGLFSAYLNSGELNKAVIRLFEKILRDRMLNDQCDWRSLLRLGVLYREENRFIKSERFLLKALSIHSADKDSIHYELACTCKEKGDFTTGLSYLEKITNPDEKCRELISFLVTTE